MRIPALLATALVVGLGASTGDSRILVDDARCSLAPLPHGRSPAVTFLVGTTLPDTVHAGPGAVETSQAGGHWGDGRERVVYGQLVRVDTLDGAHAIAVNHAFARRGTRTVVIVPWDYDPSCQPRFWSRSARWIEPGLVGFYTVTLRPDSLWAEGHPTFDALRASLQPYPHGPFFRLGFRGTDALHTRPSLDAREMFSLYAAMPSYDERRDPDALANLRRWVSSNPELVDRYPADAILAWLLRERVDR